MVVVYHAEDAKEAIPVLGFSSFLTSGSGVVGGQPEENTFCKG